jgi:hypothetical protein
MSHLMIENLSMLYGKPIRMLIGRNCRMTSVKQFRKHSSQTLVINTFEVVENGLTYKIR